MDSAYFVLTLLDSGHWVRTDESIAASSDTVGIGETSDCQLRFPASGPFAEEKYAVIRRQGEAEWVLIPVSRFVSTYVNGSRVELDHYLADGDIISFEGREEELKFEIRRDGAFSAEAGTLRMKQSFSRGMVSLLVILPVLLFAVLGLFLIRLSFRERVREKVLAQARESVLRIAVDSVYYLKTGPGGETELGRYSYQEAENTLPSGTAFLTSDSLLVTARHCIEPWLNTRTLLLANPDDKILSLPAQWALEAETKNQTGDGTTVYQVVSRCVVKRSAHGEDETLFSFLSSDFAFDTSRDEIIEIGNFNETYYWRSIAGRFSLRDMMLDDIAWKKVDRRGSLVPADPEQMTGLLKSGTAVSFMGYPNYQEKGFNRDDGKVSIDYRPGTMLAHSGSLAPGFSGGPVILVKGERAYAVGVVSVKDYSGDNRIYSVPITEMHGKGGER